MASVSLLLLAARAYEAEPELTRQARTGRLQPSTPEGRALAAHAARLGAMDDAAALLRRGSELLAALPQEGPVMAVTLPPRLRSHLPDSLRRRLEATRVAVRDLIESATTSVHLFAPYANAAAARDLGPWLERAAARGAKIRVALEADGVFDHGPFFAELRRGMRKESWSRVTCQLVDKRPGRISHAKIIIVDERRAYVGSGNLTDQALTRNFEAGAIVQGEAALALSKGLEYYLQSSGAYGLD